MKGAIVNLPSESESLRDVVRAFTDATAHARALMANAHCPWWGSLEQRAILDGAQLLADGAARLKYIVEHAERHKKLSDGGGS